MLLDQRPQAVGFGMHIARSSITQQQHTQATITLRHRPWRVAPFLQRVHGIADSTHDWLVAFVAVCECCLPIVVACRAEQPNRDRHVRSRRIQLQIGQQFGPFAMLDKSVGDAQSLYGLVSSPISLAVSKTALPNPPIKRSFFDGDHERTLTSGPFEPVPDRAAWQTEH